MNSENSLPEMTEHIDLCSAQNIFMLPNMDGTRTTHSCRLAELQQ